MSYGEAQYAGEDLHFFPTEKYYCDIPFAQNVGAFPPSVCDGKIHP